MSTHEHLIDEAFDDGLDSAWPVLGWIVLSAMVAVVAFLLAPLP